MTRNIYLFSILSAASLFLLSSCAGSENSELPESVANLENLTVFPSDPEPQFSIELTRKQRFGDMGDMIIGRISGVQVDQSGRVFIADDSNKQIIVFDADGHLIELLGREGRGPGEFEYIHNLVLDDNYIYAKDFGLHRVNFFSTETLQYVNTIPLQVEGEPQDELAGYSPSVFWLSTHSDLLVRFSQPFGRAGSDSGDEERYDLFYKITQEGNVKPEQVLREKADFVLVDRTANSVSVFGTPFGAKFKLDTTQDGIVVNRSDQFLFRYYDHNGTYQRAVYYPFSRKHLSRETALQYYNNENYRRAARSSDLPENWPVVQRFMSDDDDRLWISTIIDDEDLYEWWLLDNSGELLARHLLPREQRIETVRNGHVYMRIENEAGAEEIVKFELDFVEIE
ncbi:6-bladed beta-propeller [Rhodohalobacter sp. SW132]|uniref:6-bladed beta-propeller n=1 Tax=Rhodohalobacter sp. SW132 TaxID=2293433 RepID=UPI00131449A4|nr:6-bladed beta-propeller [Rhodohalobacter sp. SW132]